MCLYLLPAWYGAVFGVLGGPCAHTSWSWDLLVPQMMAALASTEVALFAVQFNGTANVVTALFVLPLACTVYVAAMHVGCGLALSYTHRPATTASCLHWRC